VGGARYAAWIAITYVVVASLWIVTSSEVASWLVREADALHRVEQFKGVGFVLITGVALFWGARAAFRRIEAAAGELLRRERALLTNERRAFAGLMAGTVAHDANNVLASVLFDLEALDDAAEAAAARVRLKAAVSRLIELNRRLVQVTRQSTTSRLGTLELGAAVREAVDLVRKHPALRRAAIEVLTGPPAKVVAQPLLISQIVANLMVNAGEATGGTGRLSVRVLARDAQVHLEVHDSGPGVAPERRASIFEALSSTKPEGSGMGLFSVRACARALGGQVEVLDSELGGACFQVRLPRVA
jgi:two-component system, NtrC family, sensor kinase